MEAESRYALIWELQVELQSLDTDRDPNKIDLFHRNADMIIRKLFGENSGYERDVDSIFSSHPRVMTPYIVMEPGTWSDFSIKMRNILKTIEKAVDLENASSSKEETSLLTKREPKSRRIFLVHGHDEGMKQTVARVLEKLGLIPVILHEQASKGNTVMEKLSEYADVSFAVVLLSPDDRGFDLEEGVQASKPRARQNVVFELGFFIGKLGRKAVVALRPATPEFEMPTDYSGVVFIPYDEYESWKYALIRELQGFGFNVDANSLTRSS